MVSKSQQIEDKIRNSYIESDIISREELFHLLAKFFYPDMKQSTLNWRIHELKNSGVIIPVKQGVYRLLKAKKIFRPDITNKQKQINRVINNNLPNVSYCSWNSNWLNEFSRHQAYSNILILNVEKEFVQSIFHLLLDNSFQNLYLEPSQNIIDNYISENKDSIAIIPLVTKSPIFKIARVPIPRLEKILVDAFCDKKLLNAFKGEELKTIFINAFEEYRIDLAKLINYSRRRKKENQIKDFLVQNFILKKEMFL